MVIGMLLIFTGLIVHQFEAMLVKEYGKKYGNGGMFFNAIICLFAMIYFLVTDKNGFEFTLPLVKLGLISSTMYAMGFYASYLAYKRGSFGLTRMLSSFGVILPTFYGIIFLKEETTTFTYIACAMIVVSIFLMNYQNASKNLGEKISVKWLILVALTILSNFVISILGKYQVDRFEGLYKNEFLLISLGGATVALFIFGFIFERKSFKTTFKHGIIYGAGAGIFNGINNIIILVVYNYVPLSVASPVKTGCGIAISFLVSVFLYKEKFSKPQILSAVIGVFAVILMNIRL